MRHYETVTTTHQRETRCDCDMCGEEIVERSYDVMNVEIEARNGSRYPEGGHGKSFKPDVCLACFTDKVIPALETLGLKGVK